MQLYRGDAEDARRFIKELKITRARNRGMGSRGDGDAERLRDKIAIATACDQGGRYRALRHERWRIE